MAFLDRRRDADRVKNMFEGVTKETERREWKKKTMDRKK